MGHTIALIMLIAVDFLGVSSAATHTLQYVTVVKPGNCSTTGEVDGQQFVYYSSNDTEVTPKTEWIQKINAIEPDYFKSETARMRGEHDDLQKLLELINDNKDLK